MASSANSKSPFKPFAVIIKNHYQPTYSLRLMIDSPDITIGKLKTKIQQQHKGNPLIQAQLLVYRGKLLESKTNLFQLLQSSYNNHNDDDTSPAMYIHMTLRGGSNTAIKIGLTQNRIPETNNAPKNPPQPPPEEEKYEKATSTSTHTPSNNTIPPQFTHYPRMHMPPYYMPPPPPNPYYSSQSMPDLYHPSAYAHPLHHLHGAQAFAPPTLVQQTHRNNNPPFTPYPHYMPPPPPPLHRFGVRSHSTSDLRYFRNAQHGNIPAAKIEEKEENDAVPDNNDGVNERFGLRQRRVQNVANDNDNVNGGNNNNNNGNVGNNNAGNVVREGWFAWFFRILNINVLIRLGIFMWLFGPNLGTYRFTILCVLGGFYYLHQIGILQRIFGRFVRNRNGEIQHRDPNAVEDGSENNQNERAAILPLSYVQLLQRFLIGIFASLWPTWDHRTLYPVHAE